MNRRDQRVIIRLREQPRHWRLHLALIAHRIERRLGRHLTDAEVNRISFIGDPLALREMWLRYGGHLVAHKGQLRLSETLPCQRKK